MVAINLQDSEKLKLFYDQLPHDGLNFSSDQFLDRINNAEVWGLFRNEGNKWLEYIGDETHYHLQRQGWEWIDQYFRNKRFVKVPKELTSEEYQRERDKVLKAFVRQAIPYFQHPELFNHSHFLSSLERDIER